MIHLNEYMEMPVFKSVEAENYSCPYAIRQSPLLPLKALSSRKKGKHFESIVKQWLSKNGLVVTKGTSTDHDFIVNGLKVEVKGSFLWGQGDQGYKFQQIRTSQDYDIIIFLALHPSGIFIYGCTAAAAKENLEIQDERGCWIHNQHGGNKVNSGTFQVFGFPVQWKWMKPINSVEDFLALGNQ